MVYQRERDSQKKIYGEKKGCLCYLRPVNHHTLTLSLTQTDGQRDRPWFSFPEGEALTGQKVCNADKLSHPVGAEQNDGYWTLICQLLDNKKGKGDALKLGHYSNKEQRCIVG